MRNFIRFCVKIVLYPFVLVFGWCYVQYVRIFHKTKRKLKYNDIVDGFSYLITADDRVEEIAKQRARICSGCPQAKYINKKITTVLVNGKSHSYKAMKCDQCGCALAAKLRSLNDYCPIGLWPSENDTQS
jgi:hypothetical protein